MIKKRHIKKFEKLVAELDKLMKDICKDCPRAELYVENSWNFYLMKGPTHDDNGQSLQKNIVIHGTVFRSGGGGW